MAIVEGSLVDAAFAKINLTLRVIGRRQGGDKAGYHEIEGLVAFADLADTLTFQPGVTIGLDVSGPFAGASGPPANNLVLKSAAALGRRVDGLKVGHFQLEKNIPAAAGLGGGSADAAAALRLLSRANGPVSYTHLDVYKRQINCSGAMMTKRPMAMRIMVRPCSRCFPARI